VRVRLYADQRKTASKSDGPKTKTTINFHGPERDMSSYFGNKSDECT
jgi:hypothetical protein